MGTFSREVDIDTREWEWESEGLWKMVYVDKDTPKIGWFGETSPQHLPIVDPPINS